MKGTVFSQWERRAGLDRLSKRERIRSVKRVDWRQFAKYSKEPQIAWLGHASFMVVWRDQRILFDPVFSSRVGVVPRACPKPIEWREMNPSSILLSHAHMDHMDTRTLSAWKSVAIVLPRGSEDFLPNRSADLVCPLAPGEERVLGSLRLKSVGAKHGGWRYPWQKGYQACGYVLSDGERSLYFAGDSAYDLHFNEIGMGERIIWALLPIGAYSPRWFLKSRHMNPNEAIKAFRDLQGQVFVPYHFGSYRVSLEKLCEPFARFASLTREHSINWMLPIGI